MTGRVVYDSDDSDVSPARSPAGIGHTDHIQSRPATPPQAMVALMEPSPLPRPASTLPEPSREAMHPTSSTDPSFFQSVYDEQQREIGAQLGQLGAQVLAQHGSRDPWDVPSSPMQPPARPTDRPTDRQADKRRADHSSSNEPKRQKQKEQKEQKEHIEISIPLEPTPSMLHQYPPALSSSSWDQSYSEVTHTLARGMAAYNDQQVPADPTQSTIAFPTPSMYASSGRGMGSSNDPVIVEAAAPELPTTTHTSTATPPRRGRAPLLMSSPDIIAGPAPEVEVAAVPLPLLPSIQAEPRETRDEIDDSGSELSFHSSPGRAPSPLPAPEPEIPQQPSVPENPPKKAKKIIIIKKPAVIAASDDEDFDSGDDLAGGYQDVYAAPGSPQSGSDFGESVSKKALKTAKKEKALPKTKAKKKSIPERKGNEVISIELPDAPSLESMESLPLEPQPAKRPRGRPKLAAKTECKTEYKVSEDSDGFDVSEAEKVKPKTVKTAKAAITKAKAKAKGRGKKVVDDDELSTSVTALSETSGNAVSVPIPEKAEEVPPPAIMEGKEEEKEEEKGVPIQREAPVVKPAAGLSTGLGGLGGRVLYRVGLSKKTRIAPLLKIVRK